MPNSGDVLSARLEVKDSFSEQLDKFSKALNNTENAFNKFVTNISKSSDKIEQTLDKINRKMDSTVNKIVSQTDKVANSIVKSTDKIEQSQQKSMNNILNKYTKMGGDVQGIFKSINKDAEGLAKSGLKINIGGNSNKSTSEKNEDIFSALASSSKSESFLTALVGGNFTRMLGVLGIIGAGITGVTKVLTTLDGWAQQGFNVLNSISTGLFSVDGIKEGLESAGKFETNRVAMDTLYGNEALGQRYYQIGTKLAKETPYSETEVGELQKKLAGTHIKYDDKSLMTVLDMASIKPELGASHVGFSLVDAMYGRTTSLKTNYMIDNKEVQKYLQEAMKGKITDKDTKQKVNGKLWKDAFNSKGSVNNKQEYFDLLVSYVRNQTKFNGLTNKYSHTINGLIDRLEGNWETVRADILGLDANGTGMAKEGKITVFKSIKEGIEAFDNWLNNDKTKDMLSNLGEGLGKGVHSVTDVFLDLLKKINWDKVGKIFEKIGDSIARIIDKLTSNPEFEKMLDNLPTLVEKTLNNKVIETTRDAKTGMDLASGNYGQAVKDYTKGTSDKYNNLLGTNGDTLDINGNKMVNPYAKINQDATGSSDYLSNLNGNMLTDANASTYLAQNSNLTDDQRNQIKDLISNDKQIVYNVTIAEVKSDSAEELIASLQKIQNNK